MLSDQEFQRKADEALDALYQRLASASENFDFDVEMNSGALTIEFEDPPARFVVSPNSSVAQIWVSANVRSYKFDWSPQASAFLLPDGRNLDQLITSAIREHLPDFSF